MTTDLTLDAAAWQESWDRQQEAYLPDREQRFAAMLEAVDAVVDRKPPVVLDLAGGTGSISLRVLKRFPDASITLVDVDPVLLAIAQASLAGRATIVSVDLREPDWVAGLPQRGFDAVLTATALHWLAPDRLTVLYREIRDMLRPGGLFVNADHMPDDGLAGLHRAMAARAQARRESRWTAGAVVSWKTWWDHVTADSVLGPLVAQREKVFASRHSVEFEPPMSWHLHALQAAGFSETGLIWRGGTDAAVAAIR